MRDMEINLLKKSFKEYNELKKQLKMVEEADIELAELIGVVDILNDMKNEYIATIRKKQEYYAEYLEFLLENNLILGIDK